MRLGNVLKKFVPDFSAVSTKINNKTLSKEQKRFAGIALFLLSSLALIYQRKLPPLSQGTGSVVKPLDPGLLRALNTIGGGQVSHPAFGGVPRSLI